MMSRTVLGTLSGIAIGMTGAVNLQADDTAGLGQEYPPAGEVEAIQALTKLQSAIQMKMIARAKVPLRGQHGKAQGCVEARLVVGDDVPEEARHGLFAQPGSYKATVRFSNGGELIDDRVPDVHGMAVKVHGITGPKALDGGPDEQDFVMIDSPAFFAPDVQSVLDLMKARVAEAQGKAEPMKTIAKERPELLKRIKEAKRGDVGSPLANSYWTTVPFRFGDSAAKFGAAPVNSRAELGGRSDDKDYLRHVMAAQLAKGPAEFKITVQIQQDPKAQPIEDPTVPWGVPEVPIATLTIHSQSFDSPEQLANCNAMVFTPWHALESQRPLGGINRARRPVYEASAANRASATKELAEGR